MRIVDQGRSPALWPRLATVLAAVLVLASVIVAEAAAQGAAPLGVNAVNLAWQSPERREAILANIAASGVRRVRLTIPRPWPESIDAIRRARAHGLQVLLVLPTDDRDYYPPEIGPRSGLGRLNDQFPLSAIDLDRYRASFETLWRQLDTPETRLEAVELGNELNWADFNGDFPVREGGVKRQADGSLPAEVEDAARRGIARYARMLAIVQAARGRSLYNRDTRILSAAPADTPDAWVDRMGASRMPAGAFVQALRGEGADRFIDGYGAHFYTAGANSPVEEIARQMEQSIGFCRTGAHPCTITEWGLDAEQPRCGTDEAVRVGMARRTKEAFRRAGAPFKIAETYFYTFDGEDQHSLWRCGRLGPTGRAVLDPAP